MSVRYKCTERTKNKIKLAFLQMTTKKQVNKIFVKEVIEEAGVSRACFYVHYKNLTAVIHEISQDTITALLHLTEEKTYTESLAQEILCNRDLAQYVQENRNTFSVLLGPYGDPEFLQKWHVHVLEQISGRLQRDNISVNRDIEDMMEFGIDRVFDVLLRNLENPFDEFFKALNILDKFMLCMVVSMHYQHLKA